MLLLNRKTDARRLIHGRRPTNQADTGCAWRGRIARRRRRLVVQWLEPRHLLSALPLGATPQDTAEFMLGRIGVVPVLFESDGSIDANTENWTPELIDEALAKVHEGVNWWAEALDRLGTVHSLEFVIDETFARNPHPTGYEPISRTSQESALYVSSFVTSQDVGPSSSLQDAVRKFNHASRIRLGTDWAFTIFIVNSTNDLDGRFATGSEFNTAFAFPGGLYVVTPSTRPASTITHEMGHIFWARDEYPGGGSWTDRRGYYNAQNFNAADNSTLGFVQEPSIMRSGLPLQQSFESFVLPASTMAMIGWLDSDGNGVFDVADVPLELTGTGFYDIAAQQFSFTGFASAVALPNQNSWGFQNDITLNRVDRIEYRIDGGQWLDALSVGTQQAEIEFTLAVAPFDTLEIRAVDERVGVTSAILMTDGLQPMVDTTSMAGVAFVNPTHESESGGSLGVPLSGVSASVTFADGRPLFYGGVEPDDFLEEFPESVGGARLSARFEGIEAIAGALPGPSSTGTSSFHFLHPLFETWQNRWARNQVLEVAFEQTVGNVTIDAIGLNQGQSFGRLEAYDGQGNLIKRFTSEAFSRDQIVTLSVEDNQGRIAAVRVFGHQGSSIGLDNLRFGVPPTQTTGSDGVFRFSGLADGDYRLTLAPSHVIYQAADPAPIVRVIDGQASFIAAGFSRIDSPWMNASDRFDVDASGSVELLDALLVINDLRRNGIRVLPEPTSLTSYLDVSNDGEATLLDAVQIVNELSRRRRAALGESHAAESLATESLAAESLAAESLATESLAAGDAASSVTMTSTRASQSVGTVPLDVVLAEWPGQTDQKKRANQAMTTDFWAEPLERFREKTT